MKAIILALGAAVCLRAADTTIAGTLYHPANGMLANCVVTITGPNSPGAKSADGRTMTPGKFVYSIVNGAYSFTLAPNIGMSPAGTSYAARYDCRNGQGGYSETWVVPQSATPVTIDSVRSSTVPSVNTTVSPQQISGTGAASGQALCWNGSAWAPGNCGGGGGLQRYQATMSGTSVTVLETMHNLGTTPTVDSCTSAAGAAYGVAWSKNGSGDVTITSVSPMSGTCTLLGSPTGAGVYLAAVSGTSLTILATTHQLGTNAAVDSCYLPSGTAYSAAWSRNGSGDITITSAAAMSGTCLLR